MSNQQERTIQTWLASRDPGAAPASLRASAAAVPATVRGPIAPALDLAISRVLGLSRSAWLAAVLIFVLAAGVLLVGAALWRAAQPFPPRGLIAYTVSLGPTGGTGIRLVSIDGKTARDVTPATAVTYDHSPRWSSDGRTLLFARTSALDAFNSCGGVGSIVLYDVATATERVLATGLRPIGEAEWTPAGDQVAFLWPPAGCGAPAELGFVDVASRKVTTSPLGEGTWRLRQAATGIAAVRASVDRFDVPGVPPLTQWVVASPDGAFVATLTGPRFDDPSRLDVTEHGTGATVGLGPVGYAVWSPDGRSLAFIEIVDQLQAFGVDYRHRLAVATVVDWKVRILGDVLVRGGGSPYDGVLGRFPLFWTADGRAIYWMDTKGGHVVDVASGEIVDLPPAVNGADELQWQPTPSQVGA